HLERLAPIVDEQLRVTTDGALVDAENAELADERIVDDLEHIRDHMLAGVGLGGDRLGLAAAALDEGGRVAFPWIGQQALDQVQQLGYAGTGARGDETDRN